MTLYGATLWWLLILGFLGAAVGLTVLALRPPRPGPPDPAAWGARLPQRPRHYAPARIRVVERTEPNLRRAAIEVARPPKRPGRHAREWIEQPTRVFPDLARLVREYRP